MRNQIDQEIYNLTKTEFNPDEAADYDKHINDFK